MSIESKINSSPSNYSVRHPRNVWAVRLVVIFILVISIDRSSLMMNEIHQKASEWADEWVAENNLNRAVVAPESNIETKLLAEFVDVSNNSGSILEEKASDSQTSILEPTVTNTSNIANNANPQITGLYLASVPIQPLSSEIEELEVIEPIVDYEAQIRIAYAQIGRSDYLVEKTSNVFIASGFVGPQYANGLVNQPSGESYAQTTQMANLQSEGKGTGNESNGQGYSATLNIGMQLGNNFEIHTGVNYSQLNGTHSSFYDSEVQNYQTIFTTISTATDDGTRSMEVIESDVPYTNYFSDTLQSNYKVSSIEIPLVVKYNFGKRKLSYFMSSGVSTVLGSSYSANYESIEIGEGSLSETNFGLNTVNLMVGVGVLYQVTPHIVLNFSPGYKYGIPVSQTSVFKYKASTIGVFTGLNYYFN